MTTLKGIAPLPYSVLADQQIPQPGHPRRAAPADVIRNARSGRIGSNTTCVDITYRCNARCRYCQWGDPDTLEERSHEGHGRAMIRPETLAGLGTERIVLSGGEPRLHPDIGRIISYYSRLVPDMIVITNGHGLDAREAAVLARAGATGITVSIDSIDPEESYVTRKTPPELHGAILDNVREISEKVPGLELGINATVSHATARWGTVRGILEFARDLDFVKFQPIFDDGYAGENSPELLLSGKDVGPLLDVAERLDTIPHVLTNPPGFWRDVAALAGGGRLPGGRCGLGPGQAISVRGDVGMCFWLESSYGPSSRAAERGKIAQVRDRFDARKRDCNVEYQCFCTQRIDHVWLE